MMTHDSQRVIALSCGMLLALLGTVPAAAQQSIIVDQKGSESITSTNSGDVTLNGTVRNPSVSGTNNTAGTLTAQGANTSYSINDANYDASGDTVGTYTAEVRDVRSTGSNSGSVNVQGTINRSMLNGNNISQNISATGYSNTILIKTTGK